MKFIGVAKFLPSILAILFYLFTLCGAWEGYLLSQGGGKNIPEWFGIILLSVYFSAAILAGYISMSLGMGVRETFIGVPDLPISQVLFVNAILVMVIVISNWLIVTAFKNRQKRRDMITRG